MHVLKGNTDFDFWYQVLSFLLDWPSLGDALTKVTLEQAQLFYVHTEQQRVVQEQIDGTTRIITQIAHSHRVDVVDPLRWVIQVKAESPCWSCVLHISRKHHEHAPAHRDTTHLP